MKYFYLLILATAALGNSLAQATDFLSVKLIPRFSYQDTDSTCGNNVLAWNYFTLTGSVDAGKASELRIRDSALTFISTIDLQPAELAGVVVKKDALGAYYIATLPLNARLLNWLFFHMDGFELHGICKPAQRLITLSPNEKTFQFSQKDADTFTTPLQRFEGDREDAAPYTIFLGFEEKQTN